MRSSSIRLFITLLGGLALASGCTPASQPTMEAPARPSAEVATQPPPLNAPGIAAPDSTRDSRLVAVRQLVAHLDSRPRRAWSRVSMAALHESTEGGEAIFYCQHHELQKVTTQYLGETGQQRTAYYLLSGRLAFVLERTYAYNRPITYDSATMRKNADDEVFDLAKSTITTTRSYFDHGQLLHQTGGPAPDSLGIAASRQREQRRLETGLHQLRALPGTCF